MCQSPVVARAVALQLARHQRARSLRYSALNSFLLLVLVYDLSCKCPGYTSALHYVELALAGALCASLLRHAARLLPARRPALAITRAQRTLLGLDDTDLDSSFRLVEERSPGAAPQRDDSDELSLSLSPQRAWRSAPASPAAPPSPGSPHKPGSPPSPLDPDRSLRDEFIADRTQLGDYLKQCSARERPEAPPPAWPAPGPAPPAYQLAAHHEESPGEGGGGGGGAAGAGGAGGGARACWRLALDPQQLTQFNLNLRLWLHVTVLARLQRALRGADAALERLGAPLKLGQLSVERLRALAGGAAPALGALLPYLEPFPDQRYLVARIRELAEGGCLSNYRWNGGGAAWDESRPCDAELVLHLFATYLDGQLAGAGGAGGARPFSSEHVSAAPAPPRRLALHRLQRRPPHYALALHGEILDVGRGRNNLLHALLLLVAAAAREPPAAALRRLHLGPAGLNLLWVIGR